MCAAAAAVGVLLAGGCRDTSPGAVRESPAVPAAQPGSFDVVIANGRVVDGTGAPWFRADIGITGDRITAIGHLADARAGSRIDATNLLNRVTYSTVSTILNSPQFGLATSTNDMRKIQTSIRVRF